jgi:hypothetical protein
MPEGTGSRQPSLQGTGARPASATAGVSKLRPVRHRVFDRSRVISSDPQRRPHHVRPRDKNIAASGAASTSGRPDCRTLTKRSPVSQDMVSWARLRRGVPLAGRSACHAPVQRWIDCHLGRGLGRPHPFVRESSNGRQASLSGEAASIRLGRPLDVFTELRPGEQPRRRWHRAIPGSPHGAKE